MQCRVGVIYIYIDVSEDPAASLFRVGVSATQEGESNRYIKRRTETVARTEPVGGDSPKKGQIVSEGKWARKELRGKDLRIISTLKMDAPYSAKLLLPTYGTITQPPVQWVPGLFRG